MMRGTSMREISQINKCDEAAAVVDRIKVLFFEPFAAMHQ